MSASWCTLKTCYLKFGTKLFKLRYRKNYISALSYWHSAQCSICLQIQGTRTYSTAGYITLSRRKSTKSSNSENYEEQSETKKVEYEKYYYKRSTEDGSKKDVSGPLPPAYSPTYVEAAWYNWWVKEGFFKPEYQNKTSRSKEKFVVCLPPPNVTGTLHLGHALTNSIQDAIVRWKRMKGVETVWIPGCDHAGIATQVVVEKQLMRDQKKTRFDLGRDRFLEEVWKWKNEKGDRIYEQMKLMGSSLDWSRACFTMDDKLSKAVVESFVRLYDEGLIYRSNRLVNWSCSLQSTISDIEVDNVSLDGKTLLTVPGYDDKVEFGVLTSFAYPVDGGGEITVSTTRLETMLGDVAIAVHPNDDRYRHLHRKFVIHPISGEKLPVVCDDFVDMQFGTGAVKITPAHDYSDFEVGQRHNLPIKSVISNQGTMENCQENFFGLKRFDCRQKLRKVLDEKGLFRGSQSHAMSVPVCSRSKDIVEPLLKDQWYLNCKDMGQQAMQVVKDKQLKLIPAMYENVWFDYLGDIRDWCISRQLWWGHRIPAYRAAVIGQKSPEDTWIIARNESEAILKAAKKFGVTEDRIKLSQDEDVLDTWFSSGIFPFSVHGWPDKTTDFQKYYPTNLLETGSDIIFFWVARMVMMGLKLTNQLPFNEVLLHGLLRDAHGRKMSKSLGNVVDPIDVIQGISLEGLQKKLEHSALDVNEMKTAKAGQMKDFPSGISECGADALRFSLCVVDFKSQEISMDIARVKSNRHFCNKIWQGFKFVQMHIGNDYRPAHSCKITDEIDQWILSRLSHMVQSCDEHFNSYDLQLVTEALYKFWINDFCDVYLECIKPVFSNSDMDKTSTKQTLFICVDTFLRAASPFMPFLTEELYQRLHLYDENRAESICVSSYPTVNETLLRQQDLEVTMDTVKSIGSCVLNLSNEYSIKMKDMKVSVLVKNEELLQKLQSTSFHKAIPVVSRCRAIQLTKDIESIPDGCTTVNVSPDVQLHCLLNGVIDSKVEIEKLKQKVTKAHAAIEKIQKDKKYKKLPNNSEGFRIKQDKIEELNKEIQFLEQRIKQVEDL